MFTKELDIKSLYSNEFVTVHFDTLSKDYWMSEVFSFSLLSYCRRRAIQKAHILSGDIVLDIMSGTGKNFILLSEKVGAHGKVIGLDISQKMNALAKSLIEKKHLRNTQILTADFLHNTLPPESIDVITGTFGLKTVSPDNCLLFALEIKRLLKPQGRCVLIELSEPSSFAFKILLSYYIRCVVPLFSKILRGDKNAHSQLANYVFKFKNCNHLIHTLQQSGLTTTSFTLLRGFVTGVVVEKAFKPMLY